MITGSSTLIQVFQLYQNKIKEKEHKKVWAIDKNCSSIEAKNRKIHNFEVNQFIKLS